MRRRHAVLLLGTLIAVGAVLAFAVHQTTATSQRAAEASAQSKAATAIMIAQNKQRQAYEAQARRWRPAEPEQPRGPRVKPHALSLSGPVTRPTARLDSPPAMPGPEPLPDIPAPPDVPDLSLPEDPGPDPCQTDPPDSLDECADRPTVGSMEACIQYRVDCYGPWG